MKYRIKKALFELAASDTFNFKDPLTGYSPTNEIQFSMIFGLLCQTKKLNLEKIKLYSFDDKKLIESGENIQYLIKDNQQVINEFPLFAKSEYEISTWGAMTIDIALIEKSSIVFIENKIGSSFTSGGEQLEKQIKYLESISDKIFDKTLIVLSSKKFFEKQWYIKEFNRAIENTNTKIKCYCICWEDIFEATRNI